MFRGLVLGLVLAAGAANAQGIGHDSRGHESPGHQANPEPKPQPSDLAAIKDQIQSIVAALQAANNKTESPEEKDRANRDLAAQEQIAAWAPAVFWVALAELIVTSAGVVIVWMTLQAAWEDISESRRIGQAQVRAYVSIKAVVVDFMTDFVPGLAVARINIVAKNHGQSPARNFVWRPTLQFISGNQLRQRGIGETWVGIPGASISAGDPFEDRFVNTDMEMVAFSRTNISPSGDVLVRAMIEFSYVDVFDKMTTEVVYFSGITARTPPANVWRFATLTPLPTPRDWSETGNFQNQ